MPKSPKSKRDVLWLAGVTLLVLLPLYLLVRGRLRPSVGNMIYSGRSLSLSPDGRFLASIEPPPPDPSRTPMPFSGSDLVVRRLSDEQELVRMPLSESPSKGIAWSSDQKLLAVMGDDSHVFDWTENATPGTQTWSVGSSGSQGVQNFSRPTKELYLRYSFQGGDYRADSELELEQDVFLLRDSDGLFSAKQIWAQKPIPLSYPKELLEGYQTSDMNHKFAIQPQVDAPPSTSLRVLLVQQEPRPTPSPTPVPSPTPTPLPLTNEQKAFLKREERENKEIEKLVESVLGVDGTPPPPISEAQEQEIEAEVKRRNKDLLKERERLFPPPPTPVPPPLPTYSASVGLWDFVTGKTIWKRRIEVGVSVPIPVWSNDGKRLALVGIPIPPKSQSKRVQESGIVGLDPANGKELYMIDTGRYLGFLRDQKARFIPAQKDFDLFVPGDSQTWQFFDAMTGKLKRTWEIKSTTDKISPYAWTTDGNGYTWVFRSFGQSGPHWKIYSRDSMEKLFGTGSGQNN